MPTSSIFKDVVIKTVEGAERLISALEQSKDKAECKERIQKLKDELGFIAGYSTGLRCLSLTEGGGYYAWVPEFPGCSSVGEVQTEAIDNLDKAIECWLKTAKGAGRYFDGATWR